MRGGEIGAVAAGSLHRQWGRQRRWNCRWTGDQCWGEYRDAIFRLL